MSYTPQTRYEPAPKRAASLRPGRLLKKAGIALTAIVDAENRKFRWTPPERDTDPVCGKTVRTENAKPSVHDGKVYFFCSRDCREIFEAAPDIYLGGRDPGRSELEHSHA
jgi:YHS domain-containing protein